jgi:hypothetical protein
MAPQLLCHRFGDADRRIAVARQAFVERRIESKRQSVIKPIVIRCYQAARRVSPGQQRVEGGFVLVAVDHIGSPLVQVSVEDTDGGPVKLAAARDDQAVINIRGGDPEYLLVSAAVIVEHTQIDRDPHSMELTDQLGRHCLGAVETGAA